MSQPRRLLSTAKRWAPAGVSPDSFWNDSITLDESAVVYCLLELGGDYEAGKGQLESITYRPWRQNFPDFTRFVGTVSLLTNQPQRAAVPYFEWLGERVLYRRQEYVYDAKVVHITPGTAARLTLWVLTSHKEGAVWLNAVYPVPLSLGSRNPAKPFLGDANGLSFPAIDQEAQQPALAKEALLNLKPEGRTPVPEDDTWAQPSTKVIALGPFPHLFFPITALIPKPGHTPWAWVSDDEGMLYTRYGGNMYHEGNYRGNEVSGENTRVYTRNYLRLDDIPHRTTKFAENKVKPVLKADIGWDDRDKDYWNRRNQAVLYRNWTTLRTYCGAHGDVLFDYRPAVLADTLRFNRCQCARVWGARATARAAHAGNAF